MISDESAEFGEDSAETLELFELPVVPPANNSIVSRALASDEKTVVRVLAGKTGELRQLVERYQRPVFRFVRNLIRDEHDAEDITQDVFLSAFDNLATFDARRASLLTWLFTIARNRCMNYLKRKRPVIDGEVTSSPQPAASSEESARNEFWSRLDEALDELPVEQKTAFVLAEIENLPYADIAHIEQTTLGTIKSRIHRAKQRLRAVMAPTLGEQL